MSYEGPTRNSFRASVGKPSTPLVTTKRIQRDMAADGLHGLTVPRTESRSADHRGGDRHRLSNEQALVRINGREHVVELINLSRGGAMIEGQFHARLWDRLELVLGESGEVECAVRWIRGNRLGLEFAHETRVECDPGTLDSMLRKVIRNSFPELEVDLGSDPDPVEEAESAPELRVATRHPLIWNGIIHHDYEWEVARLRNISATGALVECATEFPTGVTVFLDLGGAGRLSATVSWSRGAQTGLAFAEPFDVTRLSDSKPDVAPANWTAPDYLQQKQDAPFPWADRWERVSVEELSRTLGG